MVYDLQKQNLTVFMNILPKENAERKRNYPLHSANFL